MSLFPKELWSTLEGKEGDDVKKNINRAMEKKARMLGLGDKDADVRTRAMLEKIHTLGGDDDAEEQDEEVNDEEGQFWRHPGMHMLLTVL